MGDMEDDVIFERPDVSARAQKKESQLTCNRLLVTATLCASFFGLGLCLAIPGPTLIDLQENTKSDKAHISLIFTSRSIGYLFGSIIGGVLFTYINQSCLISVTMVVTSVATAIAPWCRTLVSLAAMILFQGVAMGFLDTGGNLMCLETWGRDNGPPMQSLHFAFGLGAFLAPLLAAPFLHSESSNENGTKVVESRINVTNCTEVLADTSPVKYSYLIIAIFLFFLSLVFMMLYCCTRKSSGLKSTEATKADYTVRSDRFSFRIQMLVLLFVFYFLYVGIEVTYGSLVSKFAFTQFSWSKKNAAFVASLFWGAFAAGRLLAVFLAHCISPTFMLIGDLAVTTVSLAGLCLLEKTDLSLFKISPETMFVILSSTLGLGLASIFPAGISWVERYMKVTGKATAIFVVGSALGEMVLPAATGYIFAQLGAMSMMYVLVASSFASVVVFIVMVNLACSVGERYSKVPNQEEDLELLKVADDESLADSLADVPNGHDGSDRKKRVTFALSSESGHSGGKDGNAKGSILRAKRMEKKD